MSDLTNDMTGLIGVGLTAGLGFSLLNFIGEQTNRYADEADRPRRKRKARRQQQDDIWAWNW